GVGGDGPEVQSVPADVEGRAVGESGGRRESADDGAQPEGRGGGRQGEPGRDRERRDRAGTEPGRDHHDERHDERRDHRPGDQVGPQLQAHAVRHHRRPDSLHRGIPRQVLRRGAGLRARHAPRPRLLQACRAELVHDGDERQARYLVWKYKGKKEALWRRLEAKYGVKVLNEWEWPEEEEEQGADGSEEEEEAEDLDGEGDGSDGGGDEL
ncbi:hypothetical protein THAOC_26730, partial [Thalassiosira oceanica]